jgi:hypothetical protein
VPAIVSIPVPRPVLRYTRGGRYSAKAMETGTVRTLTVRVTVEEKAVMDRLSQHLGIHHSDIMRQLVIAVAKELLDEPDAGHG